MVTVCFVKVNYVAFIIGFNGDESGSVSVLGQKKAFDHIDYKNLMFCP